MVKQILTQHRKVRQDFNAFAPLRFWIGRENLRHPSD